MICGQYSRDSCYGIERVEVSRMIVGGSIILVKLKPIFTCHQPFKVLLFSLVVLTLAQFSVHSIRMVRLCIASVDPIKLSSQCVMCDRREFPLSAIDCTGITKMNDLISSPLSVQEATCLIYNCRRVSVSEVCKVKVVEVD